MRGLTKIPSPEHYQHGAFGRQRALWGEAGVEEVFDKAAVTVGQHNGIRPMAADVPLNARRRRIVSQVPICDAVGRVAIFEGLYEGFRYGDLFFVDG